MSQLLMRLSRAVARGRAMPQPEPTRDQALASLLTQRAVASRMGAVELEAELRDQIRGSMPAFDPVRFDALEAEAA